MTGLSNLPTYQPILLSHQTNLSVTASSANVGYQIGNPITIPRNGILKITIIGHVSGGAGFIYLLITRNNVTYFIGLNSISSTLFSNAQSSGITTTASEFLSYSLANVTTTNSQTYSSNPLVFELPVLENDNLQFRAGNSTAGDTTYIDDLVVILQ